MKQKNNLYARPHNFRWIMLILAAVFLGTVIAIFLYKAYNRHTAYQKYVSLIPTAADVEEMHFYIRKDGTLIFYAKDLYSFAVLSENSQEGSLHTYTVGGNTINAVFLPVVSSDLNELVLRAVDQGIDIRNLYVPEDTDPSFLDSFQRKSTHGKFTICSGGEYQLFKDAAVYVLQGKDSLSLQITHGNNTFLYSNDHKVGNLFEQIEATVTIMPNDTFMNSRISTNYAFLPQDEANKDQLFRRTDYYFVHDSNTNIFCLSNGNRLLFDVYLNATGRLKEK